MSQRRVLNKYFFARAKLAFKKKMYTNFKRLYLCIQVRFFSESMTIRTTQMSAFILCQKSWKLWLEQEVTPVFRFLSVSRRPTLYLKSKIWFRNSWWKFIKNSLKVRKDTRNRLQQLLATKLTAIRSYRQKTVIKTEKRKKPVFGR